MAYPRRQAEVVLMGLARMAAEMEWETRAEATGGVRQRDARAEGCGPPRRVGRLCRVQRLRGCSSRSETFCYGIISLQAERSVGTSTVYVA